MVKSYDLFVRLLGLVCGPGRGWAHTNRLKLQNTTSNNPRFRSAAESDSLVSERESHTNDRRILHLESGLLNRTILECSSLAPFDVNVSLLMQDQSHMGAHSHLLTTW